MGQYPIQSYREPEVSVLLRSLSDLINDIAKQAVQHPYQTGLSAGIIVGMAARGFDAPDWLSFLIGFGVGYFTFEGLKKLKESSYY